MEVVMISPNAGGLAGIVALVIFGFFGLISAGSIGLFLIVVIANRADPDESGRRPMTAYFFIGAFITLWLSIVASIAVVASLINLIGSHNDSNDISNGGGFMSSGDLTYGTLHPIGDATARTCVLGGLVIIVAGAAYLIHRRRGLALANAGNAATSPSKRIERSYIAAVSFLCTLIWIVTAIVFTYTLFRIAAPGVFGGGSRITEVRGILEELSILLIIGVVFIHHQDLAPKAHRLFAPPRHSVHPVAVPAIPSAETDVTAPSSAG
jgi:hypothetical protein